MTKERKAMLMMVLCACLWSIGGILFKWISWNSFLLAGGRSFVAALVLGGFMYASRRMFALLGGIVVVAAVTFWCTSGEK